jgi:DNA-binding CsgD family transcriptional regulator/tetratricopeptide (TPR) repeat protein
VLHPPGLGSGGDPLPRPSACETLAHMGGARGPAASRRASSRSQAPGAPLVERKESLAALGAALEGVKSRDAGRVLFIGGEAGVGKTTLLRTFCEGEDGATRVLWGGCEALRTPRPLGPLLDVGEATGGDLGELVSRPARPHEVALALLAELRGSKPTVLVLEDMHWADEATLDVMILLAARIEAVPALVLATYRDEELPRCEQLRYVLGELAPRPGRLALEPLSIAGVGELAAGRDVDVERLHLATGGNPFFVTEVLAAGGERVPETVRDAVQARAARLSKPARQLIESAAVVPGEVALWLLEALAGDLLEHLEECLDSGVLSAGRTHVRFRHELARLTIEESTAPNRRLALHRAALAALVAHEDDRPDLARLAHHAEAADDVSAVLQWAPRAAEHAASSGAHRDAAAQYERALRHAEAQPLGVRTELLSGFVEECRLTGRFDLAVTAQREALECSRQLGDLLAEGDALRSLSRLLFFDGRVDEGEQRADEAVALLEQLEPGHELAMAYGNASQRRMVIQDTDGAVAWGRRALQLAESLGDTEATIYALTNIGGAEFELDSHEGRAKLERALALAGEAGLEDYAGRATFLLVHAPVLHHDFDAAERWLAPGVDFCQERGLDAWRTYLISHRARIELDRGRWTDAAESAAEVLRDPRTPPVARTWALPVLGLVRARRGDAGVLDPLEEADELVRSTHELMRIGPVARARAEAAWLAGDDSHMQELTDAAIALARTREDAWTTGELAYWRWQAGIGDTPPPEELAEPYRRSLAGDWSGAATLWRELGCPYETALAQVEGDDPSAIREGTDALQRLGAHATLTIVTRRLRERGVRGVPRGPRKRTRANPAGLTGRELEVLELLADGLRNAEIGQRLVVSKKTVDHHVSAILRKLDVKTRGEAAAAAVRLGLSSSE